MARRKITLADIQGPGDEARVDPRGSVRPARERIRQRGFRPSKDLLDFRGLSQTIRAAVDFGAATYKEYKEEQAFQGEVARLGMVEEITADMMRDTDEPFVPTAEEDTGSEFEDTGLIQPSLANQPTVLGSMPAGQAEVAKELGAAGRNELVPQQHLTQLAKFTKEAKGAHAASLYEESLLSKQTEFLKYDAAAGEFQLPYLRYARSLFREYFESLPTEEAQRAFVAVISPIRKALDRRMVAAESKAIAGAMENQVHLPAAVDMVLGAMSPTTMIGAPSAKRTKVYREQGVNAINLRLESIRDSGLAVRMLPDPNNPRDRGFIIRMWTAAADRLETDATMSVAVKKYLARQMIEMAGESQWGTVKGSKHPNFKEVADPLQKIIDKPEPLPGSGFYADRITQKFGDSLNRISKIVSDPDPNNPGLLSQEQGKFMDGVNDWLRTTFEDPNEQRRHRTAAMEVLKQISKPADELLLSRERIAMAEVFTAVGKYDFVGARRLLDLHTKSGVLASRFGEISQEIEKRKKARGLLHGSKHERKVARFDASIKRLASLGRPGTRDAEAIESVRANLEGLNSEISLSVGSAVAEKGDDPTTIADQIAGTWEGAGGRYEVSGQEVSDLLKEHDDAVKAINEKIAHRDASVTPTFAELEAILGPAMAKSKLAEWQAAVSEAGIKSVYGSELSAARNRLREAVRLVVKNKGKYTSDQGRRAARREVDEDVQLFFESELSSLIRQETGAGGEKFRDRFLNSVNAKVEEIRGGIESRLADEKIQTDAAAEMAQIKRVHRVMGDSGNEKDIAHAAKALVDQSIGNTAIQKIVRYDPSTIFHREMSFRDAYGAWVAANRFSRSGKKFEQVRQQWVGAQQTVEAKIAKSLLSKEAQHQGIFDIRSMSGRIRLSDYGKKIAAATRPFIQFNTATVKWNRNLGPWFASEAELNAFAGNPAAFFAKDKDGKSWNDILDFKLSETENLMDKGNPETQPFREWVATQRQQIRDILR